MPTTTNANQPPKKWWQRSEFWITALTNAGAALGVVAGFVSGPVGAIVLGASTIAYNLSRGLSKLGDGGLDRQLPPPERKDP
jgi:H+/Cl- antiporter ClcA